MSNLPNLDAPDGFEVGVFARTMLSQLAQAGAPSSFETNVLQKAGGSALPKTIRMARRLGIGWKTTLASVILLTTLGSVSWFAGSWNSMGLSGEKTHTENSDVNLNKLPSLPNPPEEERIHSSFKIKQVDGKTKAAVVKTGKSAIKNATSAVVAGYQR